MSADDKIVEILKRVERLEQAVFSASGKVTEIRKKGKGRDRASSKIIFSISQKTFIHRYAKGLNGPKKFALLVAFLVKGKTGETIEIGGIKKAWNKMTAKNLMGLDYNGRYASDAVTFGWVDSKKYGTYSLSSSWTEIFS
jgi:hypothetical protein